MKLVNIIMLFMLALTSVQARNFHKPGDRQMGSLGTDGEVRMLSGTLVSIFAIGGETSGILLQTEEGSFELNSHDEAILKDLYSLLDSRVTVTVDGQLETVFGVEIPSRQVLFVEQLVKEDRGQISVTMPMMCGMGGPLMINPETNECVQSLSTCETAKLREEGFIYTDSCM